ncbi:MAG: protease complex subunit PrcB family protein [Planctomycetes bacterium]|nr:protease complex subunit PrcB family protein [Planctomycetota bacterium]
MLRTIPVAAICLAAFAIPAIAQSPAYPFEEVARGSDGGGGLAQATQDLIQSDPQLQASGAAHLIPPGTSIDFGREALLVVRLGTRPTGGYGIQIRSVSVRPSSGSAPGGPSVSLTTQLRVSVVTHSPGPLDSVTKGFTSPYHVVKVPRPAFGGLVASFELADAAVDFTRFSRTLSAPFHGVVRKVEVGRDGSVSILEHGPGVSVDVVQVQSVVEDRFVAQLRAVLGRVDYFGLPADVTGPQPAHDGPYVTYLLGRGSEEWRVAGDRMSIVPPMKARLAPLDELLDAIRDEAVNGPQVDEFKGTVELDGARVLLRGPQTSHALTGALAATVRMFAGETVKVSGAIRATPQGSSLEVAQILYPEHQAALKGTLQRSAAGALSLATGTSTPELLGPAAPALATALSFSLVELDGWLFSDLNTGAIERVYVASAQAKVTARRSPVLAGGGAPRGWARRGQTVSVLRLSASGTWARVKRGDREGYMRLDHLEIGDARAINPGLSGALGGK